VSWFEVVHHFASGDAQAPTVAVAVSTVMKENNPVTVPPETSVLDARKGIGEARTSHGSGDFRRFLSAA
jgi:hypothetical protein